VVILGSRAVKEAPFCSHPVSGSAVRLDCSEESFSSSLIGFARLSTGTGFNAIFCAVQTVFLVVLEPEAAEEVVSSSYLVVGTGVRLDLRKIMLEKRPYGTVPLKIEKKSCQDRKSLAR
jgi:hypothetical protein